MTAAPRCATPAEAKTGADVKGQAGVADGRDVLIVEQIFSLGIDVHPGEQLEAAAQIEFCVSIVEIAVGQQERIGVVGIFVFKIG